MNSVLNSAPVTFTVPMPGLENVHDFALRNIDSAPGLFALESGSAPVRLFLADATVFVPGYTPPLPKIASPSASTRRVWVALIRRSTGLMPAPL